MEQVTDFMKSQRSPEKMMTLGVNYWYANEIQICCMNCKGTSLKASCRQKRKLFFMKLKKNGLVKGPARSNSRQIGALTDSEHFKSSLCFCPIDVIDKNTKLTLIISF